MQISKIIKERLINAKVRFFANDNISEHIRDGELDLLQNEVQEKYQALLESLVIDTENDHNTKDTAKRVAKMMVQEIYNGRYSKRPDITEFPNDRKLDEMYTIGPIAMHSSCSHHAQGIVGKVWLGVIPSEKVIGISKFSRLTEWITRRPSIQEETAVMLADEVEKIIKPKGLAVIIEAQHMCMIARGVKEHETVMTNSIMRGAFKDDMNARQEFLRLIGK